MTNIAIKKNKVNQRRAELVNITSLEILKQKKINEASKIGGRFFSKQFVSLSLDEVLRNKKTFLVAVKSVSLSGGRSATLTDILAKRSHNTSVLAVKNIRALYASLSTDAELT